MKIFLILIGLSALTCSNGYVLVQVRKGDNQSNVDALIHKVVPKGKFERIADTARKQFDNYKGKSKKRDDRQGLESIVVAIDSGAISKDASKNYPGKSSAVDRVIQKMSELLQEGAVSAIPMYRSKLEKFHIKPEIVHFRSGKPSVMFEVNTKDVMKSITDFLASKEVKQYTDNMANRMAVLYRAVKTEMSKQ